MHRSVNARTAPPFLGFLGLLVGLCGASSALSATHDDGGDYFWNGADRIDVTVDSSQLGVLLPKSVDESEARAIVGASSVVDPDRLNTAVYVKGHIFQVPMRKGVTVQAALEGSRELGARADVLAAGPRFLAGVEPYYVTDEILVRWRVGTPVDTIANLERAHGLARSGKLDYAVNPGVVYRLPHGKSLDAFSITRRLVESGAVSFAIPDFSVQRVPYATTNDALFPNQWHLESTGQNGAKPNADVDIQGAWDVTRGDPSVIVAMVDTGVELAHPDLVPNLVPGTDVLDNDSNPQATDYFFGLFTENHGTSTSGIACGAGDNGIGISGAAQHCKVMPIRFLSEFILVQPTIQDEADAFNFARANGAAVINNSWGPSAAAALPASTKAAIDDCVANGRGGLGTMVFFAAGNSAVDVATNGYAAYANTIAVSASTDQDLFASYSNFGNEIDFAAPSNGGVTTGTWTTDRFGSVGYSAGDYTDAFGGTSSASPLAAGIAALVLSANPYLSWDEVRDVMRTTTIKIDLAGGAYDVNGHSSKYGYGKVNANNAVHEALNRPPHGIEIYGTGLAGSFGLVPKLGANSVPKAGNAGFALTLQNALANGSGSLLIGFAPLNLPVLGGTLLVDVIGPSFILPLPVGPSGSQTIPLPIPSSPSPVGVAFYSQWIGNDPGAMHGYAFSRGVKATIQ